ncbi:MAG TPA: 3-methyl-2-oxobutanoate hydroxymethyltransferase [Gammaproteobacteria bacterium]|nr:3-methyl-2-oxobutanoate hydroxymethyltransferase [Gammaproteobacteria bacterium]
MYTGPKNATEGKAITVATLHEMKRRGEKFACLTAYDASFATLLDECGVEVVLVGDSLGMVIQGHPTTVPVTVDDMVYHTRAVARGLSRALLMADMPFMSYATPQRALDSATRLMQEGMAQMVKLEGSGDQRAVIEYLATHDIPVCAHLGLRPQAVHKLGGFKVQGKTQDAAERMLADARTLEEAGADILLVECIPAPLAAEITRQARVPVIGIGAGAATDAQILVLYDMLDITPGRRPKFAKNFMAGAGDPRTAVRNYVADVKAGRYPAPEHAF